MGTLRDTFYEQGYAIVEDVLSADDIQYLVDDYTILLDRLATQFYTEGKIPSEYKDLPFQERLTAVIQSNSEDLYKHFDISFHHQAITEDSPIYVGRAIFDLLRNENLLDCIEELIGGEILSNPIQHVRIKPPQMAVAEGKISSSLLKKTGWHQDLGVSRTVADDTEMITAWIAITDATLENGCLQIIPYSHAEMATHCPSGAMTIPDQLLNGEPTPIPIKAGSVLLMHRLMKHASLENVSDTLRWSFDLRFQPIGKPTGRDEFPSLIVRSRNNPEQVQDNYEAWRDSWLALKSQLSEREKTHRWDGDAEVCA
jgi:phytanoyl-CoA hydroxylase